MNKLNNSISIKEPTTVIELIDNSATQETTTTSSVVPLYLCAISSDKGPEELTEVTAANGFKLYGTDISFVRHGQPLIQLANIINNGGTALVKRVVAEDSTLGNFAVIANVKEVSIQKTNAEGKPLYIDSVTQQETTEATEGNTPIMIKKANIKYELKTVEGIKSAKEADTEIEKLLNEEGSDGVYSYPLFLVTDNGRGQSKKRITISPNYSDSKYLEYNKYVIGVLENNRSLEQIQFTLDPNIIEVSRNMSLQNACRIYSNQIKAKVYDLSFEAFIEKISAFSSIDVNVLRTNDLLFGKTRKGNNIEGVIVDPESVNLSTVFGIELAGGTNGSFGIAPFGKEAYTQQLVNFFNGTYTDEIYDLDNYKLDLMMDANYPREAKIEMEKLAAFRGDVAFFRDMGMVGGTLDEWITANESTAKQYMSYVNGLCYDIEDPYTRKQIRVTYTYSMSRSLIQHFKNGRSRPTAGQLYNMTIPEAIEGTVNFIPKTTPTINQKSALCDEKINYASYIDGILTFETLFTTQDKLTQLSYINNVMAIQEVIKALRTKCPKSRYSFIDGEDLANYQKSAQAILAAYSGNFKKLNLVYLKDPVMKQNKVFYAQIEVQFRDWVQSEYFKIFAINGGDN